MRAAWRAADIRAAEKRLMATMPEGALMQRAAAGLARRCAGLLAERGGIYGARVLLLVGAGNNGGDALFAGARLADRGAAVQALLLAPDRAHTEGLAALKRSGGRVVTALPPTVDMVLDGIVGIGSQGGLRGAALETVEALLARPDRPLIVSVDVPSGVDVDSGAVEGSAIHADVTVTFGALKPALVVGTAATYAGHVDLVDIGLPWLEVAPAVWVPDSTDIARWWPVPGPSSDKYTRGVAGVATGSHQFPGAALMSVGGALAGPAGMVRYAGSIVDDVARQHPSVIVTHRVADAGRVQAWLCGSGLGTDERARDELRAVLGSSVPAVIDADGLTLLSEASAGDLAAWLRRRDAPTVVTPHDREFARLAGEQVGPDRLDAARRLAARLNIVVLLKGDRTIVATPDGTAWANPTGSAVLASAGTGDVLGGVLVSLLAAGLPADRAAVAAAFVHGLAGRRAAGRGRPEDGQRRGKAKRAETVLAPVTAPDVLDALPEAIGSLSA